MANSRKPRPAPQGSSGLTSATPMTFGSVDGRDDGDPQLPAGYRHIRNAIMAVLGSELADDRGTVNTQA